MNLSERFLTLASENESKWISWRRQLHSNPELSFQESLTSEFIQKRLDDLGISYKSGFAEHGVVGVMEGAKPGKHVALRADMDALPILEKTGLDYASSSGVMHACGHDIHMTCLLAAAEILHETRHDWSGKITLVFQPGEEEVPGGAKLMLEAGALGNPLPDAIFGQHADPDLPVGTIATRKGKFMAACDELHVTFKGKGGHAARPLELNDPIQAAAESIIALKSFIKEELPEGEPGVLAIGHVEGLGATNVIPSEVKIKGTFRSFNETWRLKAHERIDAILRDVCRVHGVTPEIDIRKGYPFLKNDANLVDIWSGSFDKFDALQPTEAPLRMGGEDFAFYSQVMPSCFWRLGVNRQGQENYGLHHPKFNPAEASIKAGALALAAVAMHFLNTK